MLIIIMINIVYLNETIVINYVRLNDIFHGLFWYRPFFVSMACSLVPIVSKLVELIGLYKY